MRLNGCLMQMLTLLFITGMTLLGFVTIVETEGQPAVPPPVAVTVERIASPTLVPSLTSTPTPPPTDTPSPIPTNTATPTPMPTDTPTATDTPTETLTPTATFTPTPAVLCVIRTNRLALVNVREEADVSSDVVVQLPNDTSMDVYDQAIGADTLLWYFVEVEFESQVYQGWIRSDLVAEVTACPEQ